MIKIGIEAQRIFRKKKHGMDIVAIELIRNLQRIDKENKYYIFVKEDEDDNVVRPTENFEIIRINGGPYPYWEQVLLPRAIKRYGIELLHCTSNTAPIFIDIPLLVTVHDIIYLEKWNFSKGSAYQIIGNLYRRWNVPIVLKRANKIITVSNFERKRIQEYTSMVTGKIETVYNGVSEHFQKVNDEGQLQRIRKKYNLPDKYIFFLGNTDPKKNVVGVMKAISKLRQQGKFSCTLVMPDIDKTFLEKIADEIGDRAVMEYIHRMNYVPNHELPAVYSMASVFLYPSLRESFGIPILEAMACEIPVLTSNTSSMPEVAGDAALFVDPYDADSIANGISSLAEDAALRKRLVENSKQRIRLFSWENNAQKTLAIYKTIASKESSG